MGPALKVRVKEIQVLSKKKEVVGGGSKFDIKMGRWRSRPFCAELGRE